MDRNEHVQRSAVEPAWSLVQVADPATGRPEVAVSCGGSVRRPPPEIAGRGVTEVLEDWVHWAPLLRAADPGAGAELPGAVLLAPLTFPRKVLCAGANYYDHAAEMGTATPDPAAEPFFFLKPPTTTVVGPDAEVALPARAGSAVDWEAELGVVVGQRCRDLSPEDALDVVAGYVVANDLSDRGLFPRSDAVAAPFGFDWLAHKCQDGFCPLGPGLVPAWLVPDPQDLAVRLDVNGVVKQDSTTAQMVVGVAALLAAASRLVTLEPGDVVLTGTPAGVGAPGKDFLAAGDVVTASIQGVGTLRTRMVAGR